MLVITPSRIATRARDRIGGAQSKNRYTTRRQVHPRDREPGGCALVTHSGQIGAGSDGTVPTGIEAQAENCWKNIRAILAEANMDFDDIVKVSIFLTKSEFIVPLRAVRERFIGDLRPASTLVVVSGLAQPEYPCEIEAVAAKVG